MSLCSLLCVRLYSRLSELEMRYCAMVSMMLKFHIHDPAARFYGPLDEVVHRCHYNLTSMRAELLQGEGAARNLAGEFVPVCVVTGGLHYQWFVLFAKRGR